MENSLPEVICKSCGNPFRGYYCNVCGEQVLLPKDRSFRVFLNNLLLSLTLADGKVLKTLWLVLRQPGFVSHEYVSGRRIQYLKPLSLFFALNLIYFLFPVIQLFNASLITQLHSPLQHIMQQVTAHKMLSLNINSIEAFDLMYDQKTATLAKLIVMVFVIIASLPLNLLYRKKGFYFIDNMGFMVELACFNLFVNALLLTVILRLSGLGHYVDDQALTILFVLTNFYFLFQSGKTFYHEKGWKLLVKSVIMLLFLKVALELYRVVLFFVTIWSL